MQFYNKLNFLMNITNTSNKELAEGIAVDRSLISLLRRGRRKMPRNHDHIHHMADYFARHCSADFQFHALAEIMGKPELQHGIPTDVLSEKLYNWMCGDAPMIEHIFENITQTPVAAHTIQEQVPSQLSAPTDGETQFFYGSEGMRASLRHIFRIVQQINQPCTIYLVSDLNMEWLFENYHFVPIKITERQDYYLSTCESGLTLLVRNCFSPLMVEIRCGVFSQACQEGVMVTADVVG